MQIKVLFIFFLTFFSINAFANLSYLPDRFSLGLELANPNGNFSKVQSVGYGGSIRYESELGVHTALVLNAGYIYFTGQKEKTANGLVTLPHSYMIPGQGGVRFYFNEEQNGVYLMASLGTHGYKG